MGDVVSFGPQSGPWIPWERTVLGDIGRAVSDHGLETDCQHGTADNDAPWAVFYLVKGGHFVALVARQARGCTLRWPDRASVRVEDMRKLVEVVRFGAAIHTGRWHGTG